MSFLFRDKTAMPDPADALPALLVVGFVAVTASAGCP